MWACLELAFIYQTIQYISDLTACVCPVNGTPSLNPNLKQQFESLCLGKDNVEILPPVGILLVPEVTEGTFTDKDKVISRLNLVLQNINLIVIKFTLKPLLLQKSSENVIFVPLEQKSLINQDL